MMLGNTRIETDLCFLEALAGITRTTRSLYGPMKNRKQVTGMNEEVKKRKRIKEGGGRRDPTPSF
jgi:hypothetical protein